MIAIEDSSRLAFSSACDVSSCLLRELPSAGPTIRPKGGHNIRKPTSLNAIRCGIPGAPHLASGLQNSTHEFPTRKDVVLKDLDLNTKFAASVFENVATFVERRSVRPDRFGQNGGIGVYTLTRGDS